MNQFNFTQKPIRRTSQAYATGEPIPVAEVEELDSDTAWGLFDGLAAPTAKAEPDPPPFAATAAAELELELELVPMDAPSNDNPLGK